ncbi:hypothetical protein C8D87_103614 [Lentzea atacamensis]|uniref:Lipoprotein n=1 Tax=Lentzea atacamensis TaxID=531938 RepID=A0ABX9EDY9_9PSEU|nr:hypothetical protein C8D87_103614 [Lentzea atacamensis]
MRRSIIVTVIAAGSLLLTACGTTTNPSAGAPEGGSAEAFAAQLGRDYHADYDPLASPRRALDLSDLIVRGTVEEVFDGISTTFPDKQSTERAQGSHVTFRVSVAEVLSGPADAVKDRTVYVQVSKSRSIPTGDLAKANPRAQAVLILDDITDWKPAPNATVNRPDRIPDGVPLYFAFTDGLWMQGANDKAMVSSTAHREDFAPAWGKPNTLDDLVTAIKRAK